MDADSSFCRHHRNVAALFGLTRRYDCRVITTASSLTAASVAEWIGYFGIARHYLVEYERMTA